MNQIKDPSLAGQNSLSWKCLRKDCQKSVRDVPGVVWCEECIDDAKVRSQLSTERQIAAGMPIYVEDGKVKVRNWKKGDPLWWLASGVYRDGK